MVEQSSKQNIKTKSEGVIFEIERWSTKDGPGIRTVLFFKGCPLRCKWCCNPESWHPDPQLAFFRERCTDCERCQDVCPQGVARPASEGGLENPSACTACGLCVDACPAGAREVLGERVTADEVLSVVERDRVFYRQSGGGVTFSGGEALAQPGFLQEVVNRCWKSGISMVLETCGVFPWKKCSDLLSKFEMVFLDLKHMDPATHKKWTGASNQLILQNAARIASEKIPLVVRLPLIPTINSDIKNLKATAEFMAENLKSAMGVEILPYHTLGKGKFGPIGLTYELDSLSPPETSEVAQAKEVFLNFGIEVLHFGSSP